MLNFRQWVTLGSLRKTTTTATRMQQNKSLVMFNFRQWVTLGRLRKTTTTATRTPQIKGLNE